MRQGILGELLEPIMGKGLIPADSVTCWQRRPQIIPAFHRKWLEYMIGEFAYCNSPLIDSLNKIADTTGKVEMEEKFCSVALDIIGKTIFNYDFGSVTKESPVVKAVYSALVEVEHRSMTPAPYWDLPFANQLVPRLRKFNGDIAGGTMFIGLQTFYKKYGSPFKLCFGPKSFLVISDPVQARYLLRDASKTYDKVSKDFSFINHP